MTLKAAAATVAGVVVGFLGTLLVFVLLAVAREAMGGLHAIDVDPRSAGGAIYIMTLGLTGAFAGGTAARVARSAPRVAGIGLALAFALLGCWAIYRLGQDLDAIVALAVLPPSSLLGAERVRRDRVRERAVPLG